jgi:penicillin-binding protein 2
MEKIMESFGLNNFMNNDLAVGAKGRIPSGEFYEKRSGGKKDWALPIP